MLTIEKEDVKNIPTAANATDSLIDGKLYLTSGVLKDVVKDADTLEDSMKDEFKDKQNTKGTTIETVLKVDKQDQESSEPASNQTSKINSHTNSMLIDSDNNQYVLSKPGDITQHVEGTKFQL
jgi:hypothetical protein